MKKLSELLKGTKRRGKTGFQKNSTFNFLALIESWEDIVGPRLAKHTIPLKNVRKELTILTNHPAYSQQLSFMEVELIDRITAKFPELRASIKKIYFRNDPSFFAQKVSTKKIERKKEQAKNRLHKFSPRYKQLSQDAERLLADIEEPELASSLKSIYIQGQIEKSP